MKVSKKKLEDDDYSRFKYPHSYIEEGTVSFDFSLLLVLLSKCRQFFREKEDSSTPGWAKTNERPAK